MKLRIPKVLVASGFGAAAVVVGACLTVRQIGRMAGDAAVLNQLRNLSGLADEYYAKN